MNQNNGFAAEGLAAGTVDTQSAPVSASSALDISDPRFGYRNIRYNSNNYEQNAAAWRAGNSWGHCRPNSVLVCAIGNHWKKGSWQAVLDMVHYSNNLGYFTCLEEIMDRCFNPYDSLGAMRNEASMRAMQGYEWLCMIDNDVYPRPDTLIKLVNRGYSIIAPFVAEPSSGKPLHGPHRAKGTGIQPVRWTVLSMLMFRTSVFLGTGPELWNDSIGADEGYHFQKLWSYGHSPVIDTDIVLPVGNDPTYPLASLRFTKEEHDDFWNKRRDGLLQMPDRAPVSAGDARVSDVGEYIPFANNGNAPQERKKVIDSNAYAVAAKAVRIHE